MKIVVDINHPAHVHFFKNFIWEMKKRDHEILITARQKEITYELLDHYGFEYIKLGGHRKSLFKKIMDIPIMDLKMLETVKIFKPDIFLGLASSRAAHTAFLLRKKCIIFDDTEHSTQEIMLYLPYVDHIMTPSSFLKDLGSKQIRYNGFHELAYLHPNYFKPNFNTLKQEGFLKDEKLFIIRLVSWAASHDIGQSGIDETQLQKLVEIFKERGRVLISSEKPLPRKFRQHEFKFAPEKIHDFLYFAEMYIGEGGTMATEAATLGTPAILINPEAKTVGIHQVFQNKYKLLYYYDTHKQATQKVKQLMNKKDLKNIWRDRAKKMINNHIDVTKFMIKKILGNNTK